jgi:subtilisin family serine protease
VAVIAKSAGNDSIDAQYEPLNFWLSQDSGILSRLLIVGALTGIGTTSDPVSLASYSNTAGINTTIQERFLVESGVSPFGSVADAYNGVALTSGNGTSYAAPRVAAYAAIVHQKFPNLTAPNTADILLATARYDTLTCYPNCDKSVYGQGEASLSRALAPVGYLR